MKPPVSNCCKGPKPDTETDFAIKSEEMDWEVRFEKEFQIRERVVDHTWDKFKNDVYPSEIKDFIREVRATAVKEERERIVDGVRLMEIYDIDDTSRSVINMHGYNDAIKEVLKFIQQPK